MSRESTLEPSIIGFDERGNAVNVGWPVIEDEPPSPRPHTPVPASSTAGSRPGTPDSTTSGRESVEEDFTTPTPSPQESALAKRRPRAGTDTDARLLSAESPARSTSSNPLSVRTNSRDPSADSLEWDNSAHSAPVLGLGAAPSAAELAQTAARRLRERFDPGELTRHGKEAQRAAVANYKAVTMAAAGGIEARSVEDCLAALGTAVRVYEDDFEGLQPSQFPQDILRQKWAEADSYKKAINVFEPRVAKEPAAVYTAELKGQVAAARRGFVQFCRAGMAALKEYDDNRRPDEPAPRPDAAAAAGGTRPTAAAPSEERVTVVRDTVTVITGQLESLVQTLEELNVSPANERQFRTFTANCTTAFDQVASLKEDARRAIDEAAACGLESEMTTVSTRLRSLTSIEQTLRNTDRRAKTVYGTTSLSGREFIIKAPTFSGELKGVDFYTFQRDWDEFAAQKHISDAQLLRILLKESLSGPAQRTCRDMETIAEAFARLKKMFGNPRLLINAKMEEIAKFKRPEGGDAKRREFLIELEAALTSMHKLAGKHKILNTVYNSPVVDQVLKLLRPDDAKKFKRFAKQKEKAKRRGSSRESSGTGEDEDEEEDVGTGEDAEIEDDFCGVDAKDLLDYLLAFLLKLIREVSEDINFELSLNRFEERARASEPVSRPSQKTPKEKNYVAKPSGKQGGDKKKQKSAASQPASKGSAATPASSQGAPVIHANYREPSKVQCLDCPDQHLYAYYCRAFQNATPVERMRLCHAAKVCFRCLRSDSRIDLGRRRDWWRDHETDCQTEFACNVDNCGKRPTFRQYHLTMCSWHIPENKVRQSEFIKSLDQKAIPPGVKFFVHHPVFFSLPPSTAPAYISVDGFDVDPDTTDNAIFMVSHSVVNGKRLEFFYDSGCISAGVSVEAAKALQSTTVREGPTCLGVAGGGEVHIPHGDEQFALKRVEDKRLTLVTALMMDEVTSPFPLWNVKAAWTDIYNEFSKMHNGNPPKLPKAPQKVGGQPVSVMIGIRYLKLFPKPLFHLPSGLGIYESQLECEDGIKLVLAGPHQAWSYAVNRANYASAHFYMSSECRAFYFQSQCLNAPIAVCPATDISDVPVDGHEMDFCENQHCPEHDGHEHLIDEYAYSLRDDLDKFIDVERVGSELKYRCLRCRACSDCKNSDVVVEMSLREEREQALIESCVSYDENEGRLFSSLPFIQDPEKALKPNKFVAQKVLETQLKATSKSEDVRADVLAAFEKLRSRGFVQKYDDLSPSVKKIMNLEEKVGYTIAWRIVWKANSLSSPSRMVFDASATTPGGESLNNCLAKGENRLIKLFNILLKFRMGPAAFTTDISMAYNQIALKPEDYRYQMFLWKDGLDPDKPTELWVVTTLIYGVRPSGNLMLAAFNILANHAQAKYPVHMDAGDIFKKDTYVDDCLHSALSLEKARSDAEGFQFILGLAGMGVKGFTFSSLPPPPEVSNDGKTVGIVGMIWQTEPDLIQAEVKPLFFGKVKRGKLPELLKGDLRPALSKSFTKRTVLSKLAGLWDPLNLLAPLSVQYRLDFSSLCDLKVDWDDPLPEELLDKWVHHISEIQDAKELVFKRAVIPEDARSLDIELIVSTDASQHAAAAAVHARVPLKGGGFSVQLLCSRTRITRNLTIPKGELKATVIGAAIGHISKHCLGNLWSETTFVTDSAISLYWINSDSRPLETHVRNAVIEVRRLSSPEQWFHVSSEKNVADIATRPSSVSELGPDSVWQRGMDWMCTPKDQWPLQTISEVTVAAEDTRINTKDTVQPALHTTILSSLKSQVGERYAFSKYLYDPNKYNWARSVRVMAYVIKFVRNAKLGKERSKELSDFSPPWAPPPPPPGTPKLSDPKSLSQFDVRFGAHYYFHKATKEVKKFSPEKSYIDDSVERYGILYYTGRILDGQNIETPVDAFLDLSPLCYVKPIIDRYSPCAYAIMLYAHATVSNHRSVPVTLTESRSIAFVLQGRNLAKEIYAACQFCKRNIARTVQVEMGKIHDTRLYIAPPFHVAQCDIMGPFLASCAHKPHRSTLKLWAIVFKCVTSCAISAYVMQDYSAAAVVQAFTRFGCSYGYPSLLLIDQGTQLVSAYENVRINMVDLAGQLETKFQVGIQHQTSPTRGHNYQGMVERGIREVKRVLDKVFKGIKTDSLALETNLQWVCNELNNFPICTLSRTDDLGCLDILTPARLLLGRANRRAMSGYPQLTKPSKMLENMDQVYDVWWKIWREERVVDFIPQPRKWKRNNQELQVGDIVVFMKELPEDHFGRPLWKVARVIDLEYSSDNLVRTCSVEYKNASQPRVFQRVRLSVRHVAKLHGEDDLDIIRDLNEAAELVDSLHVV